MSGVSSQPTSVRFALNPAFPDQLEASEEVLGDGLLEYAEVVAEEARRNAPVSTGAYRDSLEAVMGTQDGKVIARVQANDFKAHWIEFGTATQPARSTIRRAVEASGKRVEAPR